MAEKINAYQYASQVASQGSRPLEETYEKIVGSAIGKGADTKSGELVDILDEFRWTLDNAAMSGSISSDGRLSYSGVIPFVYATEYRQMYSSQIMNMINSIYSLSNMGGKIDVKKVGESIKNLVQNLQIDDSAKEGISKAIDGTGSIVQKVEALLTKSLPGWLDANSTILNNITENSHISKSDLLRPYLYLYATRATKKYYIFPLLTQDAAQFAITNSFGDSADNTNTQTNVLSNNLTNMITSVPKMLNGVVNDIAQALNFGFGENNNAMLNNWVEMGKFYKYSTEGDKLKIVFPLFNTVKKDEWKRHHRFIYNFALRNMPFKVDSSSYHQPLLYDVMVPGVKRMPFAFVNSFQAVPAGTIRTLKGENYVQEIVSGKGGDMAFNIPEAWTVTIEFTDLLGPSANKVLSGFTELNITAS